MRKLFIPLAKLLGIYFLYRPLTYMTYIIYYLVSNTRDTFWLTLLYNSIIQILALLLALALLFKTEKIADLIRLPDDDINLSGIDSHSILRTGLILIGVGALIYAIPNFLSSAVTYFNYKNIAPDSFYYQEMDKIIFSIIQAILGVILIYQSSSIARFFDERE